MKKDKGARGGFGRGGVAWCVSAVGIMAATIECGKLALYFLPNVEIVTLLVATFSLVFGWMGILATVIFVIAEVVLWGVGSWVVTYFIYWPLVALVFALLGRARIYNRWLLCAVAVLLTFFFGVLSSFIDIAIFSGGLDRLFYRFAVYYGRGAWFYVTQIVFNAVLFPTMMPILVRVARRIKRKNG